MANYEFPTPFLPHRRKLRIRHYYSVQRIIDGDTVEVIHRPSEEVSKVRLLGIDTPETRRNRRLLRQERTYHLAAAYLLHRGHAAREYLQELIPSSTNLSLITEKKNEIDRYGRTLAYLITEDGNCINAQLLTAGHAWIYQEWDCLMTGWLRKLVTANR